MVLTSTEDKSLGELAPFASKVVKVAGQAIQLIAPVITSQVAAEAGLLRVHVVITSLTKLISILLFVIL